MEHYAYLIVGGGMSADAAVEGIREVDGDGTIAVVGSEPHLPYSRPPLTKGLWKGDDPETVWRGTPEKGAEVRSGRTIETLDPAERRATDSEGAAYSYDKLLLATGGTPHELDFGGDRILYFRTLDDYRRLREETERRERFAVIGAGFIGSEIAAALAMNGKRVTMVFPGTGIGDGPYPAELARFVTDYYRDEGVEILSGQEATSLDRLDESLLLRTKGGREVEADSVVAGIGIAPNTDLARAAGLEVDNGIVVDEQLRTTAPDVYAAGDVAAFPSPHLGRRIRVEHEDNALTMGRAAGGNMARHRAGEPGVAYDHLPFFYSDLFELGYEAVGDLDASLETVADWVDPLRKGVVYYLGDGRVRGVLLWDVWGKVDDARALIGEPGPFRPGDLTGRIQPG